jgi:hypothetical protein
VTLTLHTAERSTVQAEAGSIFFFNPKISLPPHSDMTVTRSCPVSPDMNLALIWPHMHKQGVHFMATTDDSMEEAGNPLYDADGWADPNARSFPYDLPMTVHAGASITYTCTYHNGTDNKIVTGQSAQTDEMCILHGMYWPRADVKTELFSMGSSTTPEPVAAQHE